MCIQEERKKSEVQIAEVAEAGLGKTYLPNYKFIWCLIFKWFLTIKILFLKENKQLLKVMFFYFVLKIVLRNLIFAYTVYSVYLGLA